jgi:hypothetical protein
MLGRRWILLALVALCALAEQAQAGCRPRPHGVYGGPCYTCGGRGMARGYAQGFYGYGSWGYYPGYGLGSYGYGPGFNQAYWGSGGHTPGYGIPSAGFGSPVRDTTCYYSGGGY